MNRSVKLPLIVKGGIDGFFGLMCFVFYVF